MKISDQPVHHLIQKYALAIAFLTLLCMVITLGIALFDVVQIVAPKFTYVQQNYYDTDSNYVVREITPDTLQDERIKAARSLTQASIILIIDIVLYLYHWRLANRPVLQGILATV